jgi:hypothetical protein
MRAVSPEWYADAAAQLPEKWRPMLSPEAFDAAALRALGARCYSDADGGAFFYLVGADLRGLFALPSAPKGAGRALAASAPYVGARSLDCFAGFLPALYASLGWRETGRAPFDAAQAPASWRADLGAPDVIFMAHAAPDGF